MGKYVIRLGSTISFDEDKEKDLIEKIEDLSSRHKLGPFISDLIRVAIENPVKLSHKEKLNNTLKEIEELGISSGRNNFFKRISKDIEEMKLKVDKMYDANMKLLCLAQFGKQIGIEQKTNNSLMAQFVLEKQLNEISNTLGVSHVNHVFESNRIQDTHEKAREVLNYIIESYDNIVTEMKSNLVQAVEPKIENKVYNVEKIKPTFDESFNTEEDLVDFGNADLDSINNFLGGE